MLRITLVITFVSLFLLLSIPLLFSEWIIGKFNKKLRDESSRAIVRWAFNVCLFLSGTSATVIGLENIPRDTSVLYVGNHRSYFDILLTYVRFPGPTGYVAKKEMLRYPLLCHWMRNIHCTFLDREDIKNGVKTIHENIKKLKNGISVCVFPEGTRNKTGNEILLPFHDGSFKMAEKSGCPIVPVTLNNTNAIFEDHLPKIYRQHVVIEYGTPIYLDTLTPDERRHIGSYVAHILTETYNKNASIA